MNIWLELKNGNLISWEKHEEHAITDRFLAPYLHIEAWIIKLKFALLVQGPPKNNHNKPGIEKPGFFLDCKY